MNPCAQSYRVLSMIICSACGRSFSVVGYTQHIYSTSHTACIRAYKRDLELANGKEFAGDLFGVYEDSYGNDYEDGEYEDRLVAAMC